MLCSQMKSGTMMPAPLLLDTWCVSWSQMCSDCHCTEMLTHHGKRIQFFCKDGYIGHLRPSGRAFQASLVGALLVFGQLVFGQLIVVIGQKPNYNYLLLKYTMICNNVITFMPIDECFWHVESHLIHPQPSCLNLDGSREARLQGFV